MGRSSAIHRVGDGGTLADFRRTIKDISREGAPLETRAARNDFLTRRKLKLEART